MHTRGYTGPTWQNQRECFFFEQDEVDRANKQLLKLIEDNLKAKDAFEFTHLVRGELFLLVDSLLSSHFQAHEANKVPVEESQIRLIVEFCDNYCKLYCKWLSLLPPLFQMVFKSRSLISIWRPGSIETSTWFLPQPAL